VAESHEQTQTAWTRVVRESTPKQPELPLEREEAGRTKVHVEETRGTQACG
jgi:hypothetical protein